MLGKKAREARYNWLCCVGPLLLLQYEHHSNTTQRRISALVGRIKPLKPLIVFGRSEATECDRSGLCLANKLGSDGSNERRKSSQRTCIGILTPINVRYGCGRIPRLLRLTKPETRLSQARGALTFITTYRPSFSSFAVFIPSFLSARVHASAEDKICSPGSGRAG